MTVRIPTAIVFAPDLSAEDFHAFAKIAALVDAEGVFTIANILGQSASSANRLSSLMSMRMVRALFISEDDYQSSRLRIAPHWWAIMTAEEKPKEVVFAPYQKCPVCSGKGAVPGPNAIQSKVACRACGGHGTIAMAPVKNPAL